MTGRPAQTKLIDRSTVFFVVLAIVAAGLVAWTKSTDAATAAIRSGLVLFAMIAPMIVMGLFLGGLVKAMADPNKVAPWLGAGSGLRGLGVATILGAITPGGPFAAFPIVFALFAAGADVGAVVAFLTSWALIAIHRVVIWELPLIGGDLVGFRLLVSLPLPLLAGWLARKLHKRIPALQVDGPVPSPPTKADGGE